MKPPVDPKRTGVKAVLDTGDWPEDGYSNPGTMRRVQDSEGKFYGFIVACPGCGQDSSMRCGSLKPSERPSWQITTGTPDDVTALSLQPSINCVGCCGWHGWLTNGVFVSC